MGIPTLGHHQLDWTRFLDDVAKHSHSIVIGHVFKVDVIHLQDHVTWFDPTIQSHSTTLHDTPHIYSTIASFCLVALPHDTNAQEVYGVHVQGDRDDVQRES
jgi:hypothetical protein